MTGPHSALLNAEDKAAMRSGISPRRVRALRGLLCHGMGVSDDRKLTCIYREKGAKSFTQMQEGLLEREFASLENPSQASASRTEKERGE